MEFFLSTTKKRSSEILADENQEIFREKVKFRKFVTESEIFRKQRGKSETRGEMHHGLRGDGRPCMEVLIVDQTGKTRLAT